MEYSFSDKELERYSRNILLKELGPQGQRRLHDGKVLVIGAGGLGSQNLLYLAAAGVGTIGVADKDVIDLSNLQRQVIHDTSSVGEKKTESARRRLLALNPDISVRTYEGSISKDNIADIVQDYDFVIEATDQSSVKYLVNDVCTHLGKPFCIGGVVRFRGQVMTYVPGSSCYRCIFPHPATDLEVPPSSKVGILGAVPGVIGCIQATEAIKYLSGIGDLLTNRLLTFDALTMQFNTLELSRNSECPVCGNK